MARIERSEIMNTNEIATFIKGRMKSKEIRMMTNPLKSMSLQELWELFPIVLLPHQPQWAEWAREERILECTRILKNVNFAPNVKVL